VNPLPWAAKLFGVALVSLQAATSCKLLRKLHALRCCNVYATAKQAKVPVEATAAAMLVVTAVVTEAVTVVAMAADRAHAGKVQTVATVRIADRAKTAVASFSRHAPKATALPMRRARAVAVAPVWASPQALPANPVHRVHLQASLTPCAPASI
jgi:hypothetical protein